MALIPALPLLAAWLNRELRLSVSSSVDEESVPGGGVVRPNDLCVCFLSLECVPGVDSSGGLQKTHGKWNEKNFIEVPCPPQIMSEKGKR